MKVRVNYHESSVSETASNLDTEEEAAETEPVDVSYSSDYAWISASETPNPDAAYTPSHRPHSNSSTGSPHVWSVNSSEYNESDVVYLTPSRQDSCSSDVIIIEKT
jgi:hypothetical protein